jgi:hypothetical protein
MLPLVIFNLSESEFIRNVVRESASCVLEAGFWNSTGEMVGGMAVGGRFGRQVITDCRFLSFIYSIHFSRQNFLTSFFSACISSLVSQMILYLFIQYLSRARHHLSKDRAVFNKTGLLLLGKTQTSSQRTGKLELVDVQENFRCDKCYENNSKIG